MKKIIYILLLIFFVGCSNSNSSTDKLEKVNVNDLLNNELNSEKYTILKLDYSEDSSISGTTYIALENENSKLANIKQIHAINAYPSDFSDFQKSQALQNARLLGEEGRVNYRNSKSTKFDYKLDFEKIYMIFETELSKISEENEEIRKIIPIEDEIINLENFEKAKDFYIKAGFVIYSE